MKHYRGKTYELTQKNMNSLIEQLEERESRVSFEFSNTPDNKWRIECHIKAEDAQIEIFQVIQEIRTRLKFKKVSKSEREFLQMLHTDLYAVCVES